MHIASLSVALFASLASVSAGLYGSPVVELDAKTFPQVMKKEHASMVAFVAPWCGHCKNLGPEFTAAASSLSPLVPFYTVNCDEERALCAQFGVQGYPSIKAFPRGGAGSARDYNGERRRGALVEYAKTLVPERVKKLRIDGDADKVLAKFEKEAKDGQPRALLVHKSQASIPFLWKVIGHRLSGNVLTGYVKDAKGELPGEGEARLLFWAPGEEDAAVYTGPMKFNPLLEWIEAAVDGDIRSSEDSTEAGDTTETKKAETKKTTGESDEERRARLRAKMDEAERRDRLRREKLAAQRAAAAEENGGSPVDTAPEPEAAEDADEEVAAEDAEEARESEEARFREQQEQEHVDEADDADEEPSGTETAPDAEPAEDADDEAAIEEEEFEFEAAEVPVEDDKVEHDEL